MKSRKYRKNTNRQSVLEYKNQTFNMDNSWKNHHVKEKKVGLRKIERLEWKDNIGWWLINK